MMMIFAHERRPRRDISSGKFCKNLWKGWKDNRGYRKAQRKELGIIRYYAGQLGFWIGIVLLYVALRLMGAMEKKGRNRS